MMDLDEMQKKVNAQVVKKYTICRTEKKKTDAGVSHNNNNYGIAY